MKTVSISGFITTTGFRKDFNCYRIADTNKLTEEHFEIEKYMCKFSGWDDHHFIVTFVFVHPESG